MTELAVITLAVATAYMIASAWVALVTVDRPRRAFDVRLSVALACLRVTLAVLLLAVLLEVVGGQA